MEMILDNQSITVSPEIQSLALYGYAVFTSFVALRNNEDWEVKGLNFHIERISNDSEAIFFTRPDKEKIINNIISFLSKFKDESSIVIRVTIFPKDFSLAYPEKINDLHIMVSGRPHISPRYKTVDLMCIETRRLLAQHKSSNMISNLYARGLAHKSGFDDVLMTVDNLITEGATWNIFFWDGQCIETPNINTNLLLPGITRKILISEFSKKDITVKEKEIKLEEIEKYKAAFITNAAIGIQFVKNINNLQLEINNDFREKTLGVYDDYSNTIL